MYDIVIPYKENKSLELQYAVRGIVKNLSHNNIHIIGDGRTGTDHVRRKWLNRITPYMIVESKVVQACEELVETEYFWLFNDDFFVMEPIRPRLCHRGTLKEALEKRKYNDIYTRALKNTMLWLQYRGIKEPLSYELHTPMLFNTKKRLEYSEMAREDFRRKDLLMRSIYANMENLGGEYMVDVKNMSPFEERPLLSTSDVSFAQEDIGKYIRERLN